jgi:heme-degrading monooxygenase HmoA
VFAATPEPPYVAVIFSNRRTELDDEGYARTAARMEALATVQPGYLGIESARDPSTGFGITVSYWATEADARAWKLEATHAEAQRLGTSQWYEGYEVRVATVDRAYGRRHDRTQDPGSD